MPFLLAYGKYIAAIALVAAAVAGIWRDGYTYATNKAEVLLVELREKGRQAALEQALLWEQLAINESALALKARAETKVITDTVVKWKVKYVQNPDAGKCVVPPEFVRVHNAAANNRLPETPGNRPDPDGTTRKFTDIDVLDVTTANYAVCHKWADQLRHWQFREKHNW